MTTDFPKSELHQPQYFLLDAEGKTLGRLATEASKLLRGKESSYYTPGIDQGNFVMIINADKIYVSGKKKLKKLYYSTSQRPGGLKVQSFNDLKKKFPARIIEKAIYGMLPKGVLGRKFYSRLYVYTSANPLLKKNSANTIFWQKIL